MKLITFLFICFLSLSSIGYGQTEPSAPINIKVFDIIETPLKPAFDNNNLSDAIDRFTDIYDQYYKNIQDGNKDASKDLRADLQSANTLILEHTDNLSDDQLQSLYGYLDAYGEMTGRKIKQYYQLLIEGASSEIEDLKKEENEEQILD